MKARMINRRDVRCLVFAIRPEATSTKESIRRLGKGRAPRRPSTHLPQLLARDDLLLLDRVQFNKTMREKTNAPLSHLPRSLLSS